MKYVRIIHNPIGLVKGWDGLGGESCRVTSWRVMEQSKYSGLTFGVYRERSAAICFSEITSVASLLRNDKRVTVRNIVTRQSQLESYRVGELKCGAVFPCNTL